jgi:hypothetical protein
MGEQQPFVVTVNRYDPEHGERLVWARTRLDVKRSMRVGLTAIREATPEEVEQLT